MSAGFWVGVDPGGAGKFGIGLLGQDGSGWAGCVGCVEEAVEVVVQRLDGAALLGVGVDAPLWWSSSAGGWREADLWLRRTYGMTSGQVQSVNSLRGAAVAQGMLFVSRLRAVYPEVLVTETHPKALLRTLAVEEQDFFAAYGVRVEYECEDERDALVGAVAAREGFEGRWTRDLSVVRGEGEQDPGTHWIGPVRYFWC